ncbi:diguanylate cyclase [Lachnospiraceae bacterium OttesenSCG-928-J05]|nr:diguanylate cyclase [Lachnospiraceae bacterium OttesenSCG-928-J05]
MDYQEEAMKKHKEWGGKIEVVSKVPLDNKDDLSIAYTPGVAAPCLAIEKDVELSYELTRRHNLVAVVTDGTAVLGLGDIGPEAGMPVMEGKCALFKAFGDVDAFPLCVRSKEVDDIVNVIKLTAGSFGGVNLEDISAPRCFEIETVEQAKKLATDLLEGFQGSEFAHYREKYGLGMSIGVALYPEHTNNYHILIKYADIAMYHAKHGGKNAYRIYEETMAPKDEK